MWGNRQGSSENHLTWANLSCLLAIFLSLLASLALGTLGLKLVREGLLSCLLSLGLVDTLHEDPLVLEHVTLTFRYMSWYMCLSIFFASRYLRSSRLSTRILLIHRILVGSLASLVPLRLPVQRAKSQVTTQISTKMNTIMQIKVAATNHIQSDGPSAWPHVPSLHETWSGSSEASWWWNHPSPASGCSALQVLIKQ